MKKILCILIIIITSCKKETHYISKHYYSSGELLSEITYRNEDSLKDGLFKEYYKNGNLKNKAYFDLGKKKDTVFSYFETGELQLIEVFDNDSIFTTHYFKSGEKSLEGCFLNKKNPIETGWFKLFREDKTLRDSIEYINIKGKGYLNQRYHFNENRKIVPDSSKYYSFQLKHIKDSTYQYKIAYEPMIKDAQVYMIVDNDINEDFSNLNELKMDTIFMKDNNIIATITSNTPYKRLKGLFHEYKAYVKDTVGMDSIRMTIEENRIYFNTITYPDKPDSADL